MFVAERFISRLIKIYGKHIISTDRGTLYPPRACKFLKNKGNIIVIIFNIIDNSNHYYLKV